LQVLAEKASVSGGDEAAGRNELYERFEEIEGLFASQVEDGVAERCRNEFLSVLDAGKGNYISVIQGLSVESSAKGVQWLQRTVDVFCERVKTILPSFNIFCE